MSVRQRHFTRPVSGRADGQPWLLRFFEISGSAPGPSTAFVAGVFGDKPLCVLALWELARRLMNEPDFRGSVLFCPAANPFALEAGTRISPDHLYLNRVFPGAPTGPLTQQIAHALLAELRSATDCVIDLHSGTPDMALWYTYDYGDLELSAAFGYTPVVTGMAQPGQLSKAFAAVGGKSALIEFGGGALGDTAIGVEGCLNVLRYRGHLNGRASGPGSVPLVEHGDVAMYLPSQNGILSTAYPTTQVGNHIAPGAVCWLDNPATGERVEEFAPTRADALLMLARTSPLMVRAGDFGAVVAYPSRQLQVPNT